MAITRKIEIEQGTVWFQQIKMVGCDDLPLDITGFQVRMSVREDSNAGAATLISASTSDGKIAIVNGYIEVTIPTTDTDNIEFRGSVKQGVYDIEVEDLSSNVTRMYQGDADITRNV